MIVQDADNLIVTAINRLGRGEDRDVQALLEAACVLLRIEANAQRAELRRQAEQSQ